MIKAFNLDNLDKFHIGKVGLLFVLWLLGAVYFSVTSYSVDRVTLDGREVSLPYEGRSSRGTNHKFEIEVSTWIGFTTDLNIVADDRVQTVTANGAVAIKPINYPRTRTTYQDVDFGDLYRVNFEKGTNLIEVTAYNNGGKHTLQMGQKRSLLEYFFAFVTMVLPLIFFVFQFIRLFLDNGKGIYSWIVGLPLPIHILWVAIVIRFVYFYDMGYIHYQHDYQGHREFIKFFAQYFTIPMPHKGWEYPQQPMYYVVTGIIYKITTGWFGMEQNPSLKVISGVTTALSCVALIYAYRLLKLLTNDKIVQNLALGFLAFTPSFIYMSSRINNDPWAASFAVISLFYIVASYKSGFLKYFWPAVFNVSFLFLTKISALGIELLFILLLLEHYYRNPEKAMRPMFHFAWVGALVLGFTVYRAYYPGPGQLVFVNSGIWPNQDLRPLDANYFLTFHFYELVQLGQSHIREIKTDLIKYSFFSYQYGTMQFGQFDYENIRQKNYLITLTQQLIMLLAIIVPIGWLSSFFVKKNYLEKCFVAVVLVSFVLVLKFIFDFPSMSNTDFRYYAAIQFMMAYFFAVGLRALMKKHRYLKKGLIITSSSLFLLQIFYMLNLIQAS